MYIYIHKGFWLESLLAPVRTSHAGCARRRDHSSTVCLREHMHFDIVVSRMLDGRSHCSGTVRTVRGPYARGRTTVAQIIFVFDDK